jgi:hypothetical protein
MAKRHIIIYCDESAEKGRYYSNFYGGALVGASNREKVTRTLNETKEKLNIKGEMKWTKISTAYEQKYIQFIDEFFNFVDTGVIKVRIMFTQNMFRPTRLSDYHLDNQYFLLYYQLIKHSFGLRYCNPEGVDEVLVSLFLDDVPHSDHKFLEFKEYLSSLCYYPVFRRAKISIPVSEITDVKSHDHVVLQGLDIVLGAMQFRLNDLHKVIPDGERIRGKRTRAKERVYKYINTRIRSIHPNFNIGITTGTKEGREGRWSQPYRHWRFVPSESEIIKNSGKRK